MPDYHTPAPGLDEAQRGDSIVLSDSSVDAEDVAVILRLRGFSVFDVPLGLLEARVLSEEPRVIVVDVDQIGAIERLKRLRETPAGRRPELFCLGDPLRAAELVDVSLTNNVFERPLDIQRLVDRITTLATPAGSDFSARGTTPPPMFAQRPSAPPPGDSVPPISEFPRADDALDDPNLLDDGAELGISAGLVAAPIKLSPELAAAIAAAEERVKAQGSDQGSQPSLAEEADCILPPDLLLSLDEPLDAADDLEGTGGIGPALAAIGSASGTGSIVALTPPPRGTGVTPPPDRAPADSPMFAQKTPLPFDAPGDARDLHQHSGVGDRPRSMTPALGLRVADLLGIRLDETKRPPRPATELSPQGFSGARLIVPPTPLGTAALGMNPLAAGSAAPNAATMPTISPPVRFQEPRDMGAGRSSIYELPQARPTPDPRRPAPEPEPRPARGDTARNAGGNEGVSPAAHSVRSELPPRADHENAPMGVVFGPGEGLRPIARAIVARQTGVIALTTDEGVRSIMLSDGDIVTASSEIVGESLVSFLAARGDLSRDASERLDGRLPSSGRHAGAALIAQSHLAQNDLWPVLRAHAEWLIGRAMTSGPGSVVTLADPPARLRAEPSVFGGATGAEVFVESARRVLSPEQSMMALGGPKARVDRGRETGILGECALPTEDDVLVRGATGRTLDDLVSEVSSIASVVHALVELGALAVLAPLNPPTSAGPAAADPLDDEAIRSKVRAKSNLVREGDYFALLGIQRDATSYEVKRAFLDLRRLFEPARLLTANTRDLYDDVALIVEVLEEAFEVLREAPRRDRYRRAIEAGPPE